MTNPLTNDPFYKRVKDALIIIFAVITLWPGLKSWATGKDTDPIEGNGVQIAILKASVDDVKARLMRVEDKLDRVAYWQRRNGER